MNRVPEPNSYDDLLRSIRKALEPYLSKRLFQPAEFLWREGDKEGMLVWLVQGHVKIYRLLPEGQIVTLYILGPGDLFGFMPLFDDTPYPAYAQAIDPVEAQVLFRHDVYDIVRHNPEIALLFLKLLSKRLRESFDQIYRLSLRGVVSKVAAALVTLLPSKDEKTPIQLLTLPCSSKEYATLVGLTPESFSRGISKLVEEGILHRLGGNSFQVLKKEELLKKAQMSYWWNHFY